MELDEMLEDKEKKRFFNYLDNKIMLSRSKKEFDELKVIRERLMEILV